MSFLHRLLGATTSGTSGTNVYVRTLLCCTRAEYTLASPDCHRGNLSARLGNTSSIDEGTKTGGLLNYATHGSRSILLLVTRYAFFFCVQNCASMILLKISWRRKDRSRDWFMKDMWRGMYERCTRKYLSVVRRLIKFPIRRSSACHGRSKCLTIV